MVFTIISIPVLLLALVIVLRRSPVGSRAVHRTTRYRGHLSSMDSRIDSQMDNVVALDDYRRTHLSGRVSRSVTPRRDHRPSVYEPA